MVRIAVRWLRRSPWYAATTIGVIALSLAIATTVFASRVDPIEALRVE